MNRLAPSTIWFGFVSVLWRRVSVRDRWIVAASFVIPAANRIATLVSFGVTIRAVSMAVHGNLQPKGEYLLGGAVFLSFLVAEAIHVAAGKIDLSMQRITIGIARELRAEDLLRTRMAPGRQQPDSGLPGGGRSKDFVVAASSLMQTLAKFVSLVVLVIAMLGVIGIVSPLLSLFLAAGGCVLLVLLRRRIQPESPVREGRKKTRKELVDMERELLASESVNPETLAAYIDNEQDRLLIGQSKSKRSQQRKAALLAGGGSALVMTGVFFLVARGLLDGVDPAIIVVMIFALRLCVTQGKIAMEKWGALLSQRSLMGLLRRMAQHSESEAGALLSNLRGSRTGATA